MKQKAATARKTKAGGMGMNVTIRIRHLITDAVLFECEAPDDLHSGLHMRHALEKAVEAHANLRGANLSDANLSDANLSDADLSDADLSAANLSAANLSDADLRLANLSDANLSAADLSAADLDFSVWPLRCGSFHAKAGRRLFAQLLKHVAMLNVSECGDTDVLAAMSEIRKMPASSWFDEFRSDLAKTPAAEVQE